MPTAGNNPWPPWPFKLRLSWALVLGLTLAWNSRAGPPTGLTATPGTNQVGLLWNGQAGATNYIVERALDRGGPYTVIGDAGAATNFTDRVVSYGMTYYYAVAAVSSGTNSSFSGPVSAVPVSAYLLPTGLPFAKGADVSSISQMDASGYTWLNRNGVQQDIFQILTNFGINAVRFRVWVTNLVSNPGAWNNQADVLAKAVRAKNAGLRIMIDFHYSDTWADPGTQDIPAAWTNFTSAQLITAVSNHTYSVLSALQAAGVTAEWVQVGNEISCGMLWTNGDTCAFSYQATLAAMINSGYAAVKAVNPATRVIIHLNNGQQNYQWWFDPMVNLGIQFDVIGLSVYPATTTNWIADTTNAQNNLLYCANRYGKEVDVSETGMNVDAAQSCENMLVDLMNRTRSVPNNQGRGVFYWEPVTAYWGQGAYLFSGTVGSPTVAMDAFLYSPNQPPDSPVLRSTMVAGPRVAGQMQLEWSTPVGATSFTVRRATVSGGPYLTIAATTLTNYTDTSVTNGRSYYYVVSAVNAYGVGPNSDEVEWAYPDLITTLTEASDNWGNSGILTGGAGPGGNPGLVFGYNSTPYYLTPYDLTGTNTYLSTFVNFDALNGSPDFMLGFSEPAGASGDHGGAQELLLYLANASNIGYRDAGYAENGTLNTSLSLVTNRWYRFTLGLGPVNPSNGRVNLVEMIDDWGANGTAYIASVCSNTAAITSGSVLTSGATNAYPVIYFGGTASPFATLANFMVLQGPLAAPTGIPAVVPGTNALAVTWVNVPGADSYIVERSATPGGPYAAIATNATTPYTASATSTYLDSNVDAGTNYYYVVVAHQNWVGNSGLSLPGTGAPLASSPPPVPTGVVATGGVNQVALAWNVVPTATSYNILRSTSSGSETPLATTNSTSYMDTGLESGTTYYYQVSAANTAGRSANSIEVSATTIPLRIGAALMAGGGLLTLSWPDWASKYSAYFSTNLGLPMWQPVTNLPQSSNGIFYLNLPVGKGPQQFFRLTSP